MRVVAADLEAYVRFIKDKLTRLDNMPRSKPASLGQVKRSELLPIR